MFAFPPNPIADHRNQVELVLYDGRGDNQGAVSLIIDGQPAPLTPLYDGLYRHRRALHQAARYHWQVDGQSLARGMLFPAETPITEPGSAPQITPAWGYVGSAFQLMSSAPETTTLMEMGRARPFAPEVQATEPGALSLISRQVDPQEQTADHISSAVAYVLARPTDLVASFGEYDAVGEAALCTDQLAEGPLEPGLYSGSWGAFVVDAAGVMRPSAPLHPGQYQIAGIAVEIRAGLRTVANADELTQAMADLALSGGILELRHGFYGRLLQQGFGRALAHDLLLRSADPRHPAQFSHINLDHSGSQAAGVILQDLRVFTAYDDPFHNNEGLSWNGGGDKVAQIDVDGSQNLRLSQLQIRSDFRPASDRHMGVPWRLHKQTHQLRARFKRFRAIDGELTRNLTVEGCHFSTLGGGVWVSGEQLRLCANTIEDYWFDPFNIYAPSDGVEISGNRAFNQMGDYLHADFLQCYDKRSPRRAIHNLVVARNLLSLGAKSAGVVHSDDGRAFPKHQGIFTQQLSAEGNHGWVIEDNVLSCYGHQITLPHVLGARVERNTALPLFKAGENLRSGNVNIRVARAQDCLFRNNCAGVLLYEDGGGNQQHNNQPVATLTALQAAFRGQTFDMEEYHSADTLLSDLRRRQDGSLAGRGDIGAIGVTLDQGRVNWSLNPPQLVSPRVLEPAPQFIQGAGQLLEGPVFSAAPGSRRKVFVFVAGFDQSLRFEDVALHWGTQPAERLFLLDTGYDLLAAFQFCEADFVSAAPLRASFDHASTSAAMMAVTVAGCAQTPAEAVNNSAAAGASQQLVVQHSQALVLGIGHASVALRQHQWQQETPVQLLGEPRVYGGTASLLLGHSRAQGDAVLARHTGAIGRPGCGLIEVPPA